MTPPVGCTHTARLNGQCSHRSSAALTEPSTVVGQGCRKSARGPTDVTPMTSTPRGCAVRNFVSHSENDDLPDAGEAIGQRRHPTRNHLHAATTQNEKRGSAATSAQQPAVIPQPDSSNVSMLRTIPAGGIDGIHQRSNIQRARQTDRRSIFRIRKPRPGPSLTPTRQGTSRQLQPPTAGPQKETASMRMS